MAFSHSSLAISMLLLSLAIVSSAADYGYFPQPDVQKPNPEVEKPALVYVPSPRVKNHKTLSNYVQNSPELEKPTLGYLPKPELEKPEITNYYVPKPELEKLKTSGSGHAHLEVKEHKSDCMMSKPKIEKPKTDRSGYAPKPEIYGKPQTGYAPKPETEKPKTGDYVAKPEIEQSDKTNGYVSAPKPEDKKSKTAPKPAEEKPKTVYAPKPEIPKSNGYGYAPEVEKPKANGYGYAPKTEEETLLSYITGIQGMIYCKSGAKLIPLQGALARITCPTVDKNGHASAAFSVVSQPTDAKGYFFTTVSSFQLKDVLKVTECKAFLEKSPSETCKVATDANKGITGASLSSYNLLKHRNVKLFSVGPFFYTPESKPAISRGY